MTTRTYLYCLLRDRREPDLVAAPRGVPGAGPLRPLPATGDLWLVVSDVPAGDYDEAAIARGLDDLDWVSQRALGHERVVEHLMQAPPGEPPRAVVPVKLLTLFRDDLRARDWARAEAPRLAARLERLAGRVELGVRISRSSLAAPRRPATGGDRPASGADFLRAKQRQLDERRERSVAATDAVAEAHEELAATSEETRRRPVPPESGILLDAVYLLAAAGVEAFERQADAAARRLAGAGCELTLTGPWPPYHFVEEAG